MNLTAALLAQILHLSLVLAAAPFTAGLLSTLRSRLAGATGPSPLQPFHDLLRLLRKQPVSAESASPLSRAAPPVILVITIAAASLVPSFTRSMLFAPLADFLLVLMLLGLTKAVLALALLDAGAATGAPDAQSITRLAIGSGAPVFLAALALAAAAGSSNISLIIGQVQDHSASPLTGPFLATMALALAAFTGLTTTNPNAEFSGRGLALLLAAEWLRLLVWFNLIGAIAIPAFMAGPLGGIAAWPLGLSAWLVRTVLLTFLLAGILAAGRPRRVAPLFGIASALGILASLFILIGTGRM